MLIEESGEKELAIRLLGGFSVSIGGEAVPDNRWRLRKVKNLVKILALASGHRLHRDQVIDALWPDSTLKAGSNLFYQTLHAARRVLERAGSACLLLENGFLSLSGGSRVDVDRFEAALTQTNGCQDPEIYQYVLGLYTGELLPEDIYEEWTIQRREVLRQQHLKLLLDLARLEEARQNYLAGIETLQRLLAADRGSEEGHAMLMRFYALSGQRQQALRQYQTLREVLQEELDTEPSRDTAQLVEAIQAGRFSPAEPSTGLLPDLNSPRHNLPAQLTSFIGREKQLAEISQLVRDNRLVTLTGSGGTGKTRLALKAAEGLLQDFVDGVFLVELASLTDPERIPQFCVQSLHVQEQPGISPTDSLVQSLEHKHLLLILDNCEHVIIPCVRLVNTLVRASQKLHILATSREILSMPGETPYRVPSLELPDLHADTSMAEIARVEAVQLFVDRAAQVSPGLTLTAANAGLIAQIGQRLDGIPLAIELAAARARMMTVEQIASRLDNAFHLLTGGSRAALPRQQTLKAMIDWSYNLLSSKERLLFQRLSVFAGSWNLETAEEVCPDEPDGPFCSEQRLETIELMDLMAQLVDKSLVIAEAGEGEVRYRMLEIIRQYARDRLIEAGCGGQVRSRHLAYFARLSGQAEPLLRGRGMIAWFARVDDELDNFRAALEWSMSDNVVLGLKITSDLMWYWWIRGLFVEGHHWMGRLLAEESAERGAGPLENERALQRARCLRDFGFISSPILSLMGTDSLSLLEESISILRRSGQPGRRDLAICYIFLNPLKTLLPEQELELVEILRQEEMLFYLSEYIWTKQGKEFFKCDLEMAEFYGNESLKICRDIEDLDGLSSRAKLQGMMRIFSGDYTNAEVFFNEALDAVQKTGNRWWEISIREGFVQLALVQGQYEKAAYLNDILLKKSQEINASAQTQFMNSGMAVAWARLDTPQINRLANEMIEKLPNIKENWKHAYLYLGRVALAEGDLSLAEKQFKHLSFRLDFNQQDWIELELFFIGCAALFQKQSKMKQAVQVLGALDYCYQRKKYALSPRERSDRGEILAAARSALDDALFTSAWQAGQAMTMEQANRYVQSEMGRVNG